MTYQDSIELMEEKDLVTAVSYVERSELPQLLEQFERANVLTLVSEHGPGSRFQSFYYRIKVRKEDVSLAKGIVNRYKQQLKEKNRKCPRCGHAEVVELSKKSIWERVYYIGTTLAKCKRCGKKFGI